MRSSRNIGRAAWFSASDAQEQAALAECFQAPSGMSDAVPEGRASQASVDLQAGQPDLAIHVRIRDLHRLGDGR